MPGHTCYHCKSFVEESEAHDCWTTTESALTKDLSEDLRDAWERLRDAAVQLGEQRVYASHRSIMFSRKSCYFFVRPKRSFLELNVFMPRAVRAPQVKRVLDGSATRRVHVIHVRHRDEVEAPITDWLKDAYDAFDAPERPNPNRNRTRTPRRAPTTGRTKRATASRKRAR